MSGNNYGAVAIIMLGLAIVTLPLTKDGLIIVITIVALASLTLFWHMRSVVTGKGQPSTKPDW